MVAVVAAVAVVAVPPRATGHGEQTQFIDAMWRRAAQSRRNSEAPKTHKWDIDHSEGAEGAELYLSSNCPPLAPPPFLSAHSTVSVLDSTSRRPWGALLTAPRGAEVKGGMWECERFDSGCSKEPDNGGRFCAPATPAPFAPPQGPAGIHRAHVRSHLQPHRSLASS